MSGDALPPGGIGDVGGDVTGGAVDGAQNVAIGKEIQMHIDRRGTDDELRQRHDRDMIRQEAATDRNTTEIGNLDRRLTRLEDIVQILRDDFREFRDDFRVLRLAMARRPNWTLLIATAAVAGLVLVAVLYLAAPR